ncbi:choice-of-anchor D domain-containing protein [Streptacidiphilus jeojiense]|uniref:Ig-like domain-containing protein n=1 Tax=Streptacidiphilus jeojiense TaxID=436229 RepID=UPI001E321390|nr:choice-of-anchor D domain-containing protein [Streptacidiphilus jeojiense]
MPGQFISALRGRYRTRTGTSTRALTRARRGRTGVGAVLSSVVTAALIGTLVGVVAPPARADQGTQGVDNLRTNWDRTETSLSPAVVQSSAFGKLFATQLDGQVYAQPLVVGNEVIAVTENNTAYGLDSATGSIIWSKNFGPSWPASAIACSDLTPNVGATATPVYDASSNTLYFTTKVDDGTTTHRHPQWLMHAVDPASGAERSGWPVTISGSPGNDPTATFDAFYEQQRPGLLLLDGVVYAGFGAHCDAKPYRGYVVGVSTTTHSITSMWTTETGTGAWGAGVWQSGGGLVSDGSGRIFFSTGNGISPAPGASSDGTGNLAESVVRLQVNADGSLSTADYFSPSNAATLDVNDQDISSGAPLALPDGFGTTAHPHLMVEQGKDGRVFLLDRDNLGGMGQAPGGGDAVVGVTGPYQGQWGHPAFWGGDGGYVYLVGNNGPLRALKYGVNGLGDPALTLTGQSQDVFGYTSGSPVVTSNGTDSSSALVWMVSATGATGAGGTLRAYSPTPDGNGLLPLLWSAPIGTATKFSTPTASGGRVYVGTRDGLLYGFGSPARTAVTASAVDLGQVAVGASGSGTMELTATQNVTVTGLTASASFAVTAPTLPRSLATGATLDVPVSFSPTTTGGVNGTLTVALSDGEKLVFALHGVGTRPGLGAAPTTMAFGTVPTGTTSTMNLQITNTGTDPETLGTITAPSGPFTASGLPAAGTVVAPGNSFVASVTYTPAGNQADSSALTVASSSDGSNHSLSVPVTGTAVVGQGHLVFSAPTVAFGPVPVGSSKTLSFTITNTGNIPVTLTKAKAPDGDFTSPVPLSEGLVIGPDQTAVQSVTLTPRTAGALTGAYEVTGDGVNADGTAQGAMYVQFTATGTGTAVTTSAQSGTWTANGTAVLPGDGSIQLNQAVAGSAGSAVFDTPLLTEGLRATFTAKLGPGTGGDGMTLSLLDPSRTTTKSVGAGSAGLGIGGQPGVVVALSTGYNSKIGSSNFVGVGYSTAGSSTISYLASAKLRTSLRQGTHQVDVRVAGGHVYVSVDGVQVVDATPTLSSTALLAFSGATGVGYDAHTVSAPVVSAIAVPPSRLVPIAPTRFLDTRSGTGGAKARVGAGGKVVLQVAGVHGVPATGVTAVVMNVTAVGSTTGGYVTAYPDGQQMPTASSLNFVTGQTLANLVTVPVFDGKVDLYNAFGQVNLVADVTGYYTASGTGSALTAIAPTRFLDTRSGTGAAKARVGAGGKVVLQVAGVHGVPATGVTAVVMNVTAVGSTTGGYVTAYPDGQQLPTASSLNFVTGQTLANLAVVPVVDGKVDLYNAFGQVDLVADVTGYFSGTGSLFSPAGPVRLLDTRNGTGAKAGAVGPGGTVTLQVTGANGVPASGVTAVVLNVTAVGSTTGGYLTVYPDGQQLPTASNLNFVTGQTIANQVLVPVVDGKVVFHNSTGSVQVVADLNGYFD